MENRNIRATLSYDGTEFLGWQSQAKGRTVQDTVEAALGKLHGHSVSIRVAGRTDSGVHAAGQTINFESDSGVPDGRFPEAVNRLLPRDVRFLESCRVPPGFDARFNARVRVYLYRLANERSPDPWSARFSWNVHRWLDIEQLNEYAAALVGTHDFTTFAAAGDTSESKVRTIQSAAFYPRRGLTIFKIAGNAFLYRMVRSLVGTMVELGSSGAPAAEMARLIDACDRDLAGETAPAWGLCLSKVIYDENEHY